MKAAFRKMDDGKTDLIAYNDQSLYYFLGTLGIDPAGYKTVFVMKESSVYYGFHKDTPDSTIRSFQRALEAVKREKSFEDLERKYGIR